MSLYDRGVDILRTLVGFDTTSRRSNLALIEWVEAYLAEHGVETRRVPNADGSKSNLMARIGPACVVGNEVAFQFRIDIDLGGTAIKMTSTDVMTFDDDGLITSMRAYPDGEADPDA